MEPGSVFVAIEPVVCSTVVAPPLSIALGSALVLPLFSMFAAEVNELRPV
jgi:hypothetical protein